MSTGSGAVIILTDAPSDETLIETIDGDQIVLDDAPATVGDLENIAGDAIEEIKETINESESDKWLELNNRITEVMSLLSTTLQAMNQQQATTLEVMQSAAMNYNNLTNQITSMTMAQETHLKESTPEPTPEPEPASAPADPAAAAEEIPAKVEEVKQRKKWI